MSSPTRKLTRRQRRTRRRALAAARAQLALIDTTGQICPVCGAWRCPHCMALILTPEDHVTLCPLLRWTGKLPDPYRC